MTKHQEYLQRMLEINRDAFAEFRRIHEQYALDEASWQKKFNLAGEKIMKIIREWEGKLCQQSEKAGYGNYTGGLAEKFQAEIKKEFPLIDHVGLIPKPFVLKKITL